VKAGGSLQWPAVSTVQQPSSPKHFQTEHSAAVYAPD
jgi:hypothetical protein